MVVRRGTHDEKACMNPRTKNPILQGRDEQVPEPWGLGLRGFKQQHSISIQLPSDKVIRTCTWLRLRAQFHMCYTRTSLNGLV